MQTLVTHFFSLETQLVPWMPEPYLSNSSFSLTICLVMIHFSLFSMVLVRKWSIASIKEDKGMFKTLTLSLGSYRRLKARLWECFDAHNYDKLSTCFEDVLKKDPTCRHSLTKLIDLHIKGSYATDCLEEMIALHLEATYGDHTIWKEFALCLLKLSRCEEDNLSMCGNGEQVESEQRHATRFCRSLASFVEGMSGKTWKFRCKWWLNRHFSKHILVSEIAEGDLKLISYKAACASHLYGREMVYVVCVLSYIKEHDRTLFSFLHTHMQNSVGIFSNLVRKQL